MHGVRKKTYEYFMENAKYERLMGLLNELGEIKSSLRSRRPLLRINYAVNNDNVEELGDFFKVFGHHPIDVLQIRPINKKDHQVYTSDLREVGDKYTRITNLVRSEAAERNIVCLITSLENIEPSSNASASLVESVLRYISPQVVWKTDFDWKEEEYREYCKRTRWRKAIFKSVVRPKEPISQRMAARYDIDV